MSDSTYICVNEYETNKCFRDVVYLLFRNSDGLEIRTAGGSIQLYRDGKGIGRPNSSYANTTQFYREVVEPLRNAVSADTYEKALDMMREMVVKGAERFRRNTELDEGSCYEFIMSIEAL